MKRLRWLIVAVAGALAVALDGGAGGRCANGNGSSNLTATDVGITPTEIRIGVIADTGSPLAPGLFQGAVDGVQAWADYMNAKEKGLAGRKIVIDVYDSKLTAERRPQLDHRGVQQGLRRRRHRRAVREQHRRPRGVQGRQGRRRRSPRLPDRHHRDRAPVLARLVGHQPADHRLRDQGPEAADVPRQPGRDELVPQEVRQGRAARALPVPVRPEVGEELAGPGVHVATEGGHQAGRHLRRLGACSAERRTHPSCSR